MIKHINEFMPHGHCYFWQIDILLMNVISDTIIALCYMAIPFVLSYILVKRKDIPFRTTIKVFIIFIFFCSMTHIMEIINVWIPLYYLTGIIKVTTAIVSVLSLVVLLKSLSTLLTLPSLDFFASNLFSDFKNLLNKLPIGVLLSDNKGKVKFSNEYITELFGYTSENLYDQPVEILLPEHLKKSHENLKEQYFNDPIDKEMGENRVVVGQSINGEIYHLEVGLRTLSNNLTKLGTTIAIIKDVSREYQRKQEINEKNELLRITSSNLPSLLSFVDKTGTYRYVNDTYERLWKVKKEDIIGKNYKDFLDDSVIKQIEDKMNDCLRGIELNFKASVNFPEAGNKKLDIFYIPNKNEKKEITGVIVLANDITVIESTLSELETSNELLQEYAFLVSHDLRAPARHIGNFCELLKKELCKDVQDIDKITHFTNILISNSNKIQDMISAILKIASINKIKPYFVEVLIYEFILNFCKDYQNKAKIVLNIDSSITLNIDNDLMKQVLDNLISNSISHSHNTPSIQIEGFYETPDTFIIDFKDDGPGISENELKRIFAPFSKGKSSHGLGLGLAIVKRSLSKMNCKIQALPSSNGVHFRLESSTYSI